MSDRKASGPVEESGNAAKNGSAGENGNAAEMENAPESENTSESGNAGDGKNADKPSKKRRAKKRERKKVGADGEMAVTGHLRELRNRLLICAGAFLLAALGGMAVVRDVVRCLLDLGERYSYTFVYIAPQELLVEYFSVDLLLAALAALPVILYEVWAFLRPGLKRNERLFYLLTMAFGLLFAGLGILFAYRILVPFMLFFLISLSRDSGVQAAVSVQNYLSFLLTIFVIFAAVFELPVVSVLLTQLNILKVEWLKKIRRGAIVAVFFVAAVITPPDVVSQVLVAVPLLGLYELSVFLCTLAAKLRRPGGKAETDAAESDETT